MFYNDLEQILKLLFYFSLVQFKLIINCKLMKSTIQALFTRPHRQTYFPYDLGPCVIHINHNKVSRHDLTIQNKRNIKIQMSFYQIQPDLQQNCVIYLHTHHGSRLQGTPLAESILKNGFNFCIFDFSGYGNSEGDTVTLGIQQVWDIEAVIQQLKHRFKQRKFVLWGRSMGAVTALLFLYHKRNEKHSVIGGVYDSPFYSLQKLTLQLGSKNTGVPEVVLKPLVFILKSSLQQKIDFAKLDLEQRISSISVPGIFIASKQDQFVHYFHSELLHKNYGGKKQIYYIDKDHNQTRKQSQLGHVFKFIKSLIDSKRKICNKIVQNSLKWSNISPQLYQNVQDLIRKIDD